MREKKGNRTAGTEYNNMDHTGKKFQLFNLESNIDITKYFNYEPRFSGVFSRDSLPRIKYHVYVINLDGKQNKRTNWASLFIRRNTAE